MPRIQLPIMTDVPDPQQAGGAEKLSASYFNKIKDAIEETPYSGTNEENGDNIGNTIAIFESTTSNENIGSGQKMKTILARCQRWFSRLKMLAFKDTITTSDMNDSSVTTAKIANGAVTNDKISSGIAGSKISDATITNEKLASGISGSKISGAVASATKASNATTATNYNTSTGTIKSEFEKINGRLDDMGFNESSGSNAIGSWTVKKLGKFYFVHYITKAYTPKQDSETAFNLPSWFPSISNETTVLLGRKQAAQYQFSTWYFTINQRVVYLKSGKTTTISSRAPVLSDAKFTFIVDNGNNIYYSGDNTIENYL